MIQHKLGGGNRPGYSALYAAPRVITVGDQISPQQIAEHLESAGYRADGSSRIGNYRLTPPGMEIVTGPDSYFQPHTALIEFSGNKISRIRSITRKQDSQDFGLEPLLLTNVFGDERQKRHPVTYQQLPRHVIDAIVSVEDKRFFQHSGLDLIRLVKAAYVDLREGSKEQGASTITMQLARSFWLDQRKTFKRKIAEIMLAAELERRFTKEQLLEMYANEVYLGRRGSFAIHGFGEGARAYFGKNIADLTIAEAAMLAGIIQRPSYFNPFRHPERVRERRDLALLLIHQNGAIDAEVYARALREPIRLSPAEQESSEAPYFVEVVNNHLQDQFADWDFATRTFRVYTSLDLDLQREAVEAVKIGMAQVDKIALRKKGSAPPQVALVALDPRNGQVKALVGGRNYEQSQLNRALALRQPGSSFKPFVYAAGLQGGLNGRGVTTASVVDDSPTTFIFNRQKYQPANYGDDYYGEVTLRQALKKSLNIASIKVAERAGFDRVVNVARAAGITSPLQGTPSIALGSYEVTPLEIAEAYTIFVNAGHRVPRAWATSIRDNRNRIVYRHEVKREPVLDPRVAYIMVNMMEDVVKSGTAASVRSRGFTLPAAGKTGTSRDGWFAGFTSNLLTVVWVGYDDNRELNLEGSKSALPVWTEFMKRAHKYPLYRNPKPFQMPAGIVKANIDIYTGKLATDSCSDVRTELFVAGTQPKQRCHGHDYYLEDASHRRRDDPTGGIFRRIWGVFR